MFRFRRKKDDQSAKYQQQGRNLALQAIGANSQNSGFWYPDFSKNTITKTTVPTTPKVPSNNGYLSYNQNVQSNQVSQNTQAPTLTGNFLVDQYNNPEKFNGISFQDAYNSADNLYGPYYDELIKYKKSQFEDFANSQRASFDNYLQGQEANLQTDRNKLDVDAGKNNYAFSEGIRNNQRTKLQESYNRDINAKRAAMEYSLGSQARDLEYDIGKSNMGGLNMRLGTGSANAMDYNPSISRGTSRFYRNSGYAGRIPTERDMYTRGLATGSYGYSKNSQYPGFATNY